MTLEHGYWPPLIRGPFTVEKLLRSEELGMLWYDFNLNSDFNEEAVAGTGTTAIAPRFVQVSSGATAAGTAARRQSEPSLGWSLGKANGVINWSKRVVIVVRFRAPGMSANGITRVLFGPADADGVKALDDKGIGFECRTAAEDIFTSVHSGSALSSVDSTQNASGNVQDMTIISDGAGNVSFYLDGVFLRTDTGGPTGDSTASHCTLNIQADNGVDNTNNELQVFGVKVGIAQ